MPLVVVSCMKTDFEIYERQTNRQTHRHDVRTPIGEVKRNVPQRSTKEKLWLTSG